LPGIGADLSGNAFAASGSLFVFRDKAFEKLEMFDDFF
jgi:hypothetical protein